MPPKPERINRNVLALRHAVEAGWQQRYLLLADIHLDNPHCDRRMLVRLLDEAKQHDTGVMCIGDTLDAMGGRNDPRRSKSGTRRDQQADNYLDLLVNDTVSFFEPYRDALVMFADGNHETSIRRNLETDLLERVCRGLDVAHMGYSGWIRFMFSRAGTGGDRHSKWLYFHHGAGGGGEVTRGVIGTNRRAVYLPDATFVVTGHIHEAWLVEIVRHRISDMARTWRDSQWHIQLPTLKDEFALEGGYHVEKGRSPRPLGGWWLKFFYNEQCPGRAGFSIERAM